MPTLLDQNMIAAMAAPPAPPPQMPGLFPSGSMPAAAAGGGASPLPSSLASLDPEHFGGIANTTSTEAEKYQKAAAKQYEKARKWQTTAGILNLVGGLASTANQIYQATRGRQGLLVGAPLQQLAEGANSMFAAPAQGLYEQNASKAGIAQIPNMDPTLKQALMASVDAGAKDAGFKGALEAMKADNKTPGVELAMVTGHWPNGMPVSAEERANYEHSKSLGKFTINLGDKTADTGALQEISRIQKQLIDGNYSTAEKPQLEARISELQGQIYRNVPALTGQEDRPKPDGLKGKNPKPAAKAPPGAVAKAPGSDGKLYYIDAKGQKLGQAQ